jgi:hypothetical protein
MIPPQSVVLSSRCSSTPAHQDITLVKQSPQYLRRRGRNSHQTLLRACLVYGPLQRPAHESPLLHTLLLRSSDTTQLVSHPAPPNALSTGNDGPDQASDLPSPRPVGISVSASSRRYSPSTRKLTPKKRMCAFLSDITNRENQQRECSETKGTARVIVSTDALHSDQTPNIMDPATSPRLVLFIHAIALLDGPFECDFLNAKATTVFYPPPRSQKKSGSTLHLKLNYLV